MKNTKKVKKACADKIRFALFELYDACENSTEKWNVVDFEYEIISKLLSDFEKAENKTIRKHD